MRQWAHVEHAHCNYFQGTSCSSRVHDSILSPEAPPWTAPPQSFLKRADIPSWAQGTLGCEGTSSSLHTAQAEVLGDHGVQGEESQDVVVSHPRAQSMTSSSLSPPGTSDPSAVVSATPRNPFWVKLHSLKPPLGKAGLATACSLWRSSSCLGQHGRLTPKRAINGLAGDPQHDLANRCRGAGLAYQSSAFHVVQRGPASWQREEQEADRCAAWVPAQPPIRARLQVSAGECAFTIDPFP